MTSIAVAGAAGFVGRPLVDRLARRARVIALSRTHRAVAGCVEWRQADLLSMREAQAALAGADRAVYLVHSMLPADRLVQADFEDLDLLAADNFARACAAQGVRQIVYLGGLLPAGVPLARLSRHLRSRAEVERALAAYGVPVTVLRAGLVIGRGGSSLAILQRMARRLPFMVCPRWTDTPTQPIALADVVALLDWTVGRDATAGQVYDVGGPDVCTYRQLLLAAATRLGRRAVAVSVPVLTPRLSRLWVSLVTGAPRALAEPLIESLSHSMVARDRRLQEAAGVPGEGVAEALGHALGASVAEPPPRAFQAAPPPGRRSRVRSLQRLPIDGAQDMRGVAAAYVGWLDARFRPLVRADADPGGGWRARLGRRGPVLLDLIPDPTLWTADRAVFTIRGGLLATPNAGGSFEFRRVLGGEAVLCSLDGFVPRIAWPLYLLTQAPLHVSVMRAFGRAARPSPARAPTGR